MKGLLMDKIDITKKVATFVVGAGTSKIVSDIIANNSVPTNLYSKIVVVGAGVVIGMMAADATKDYTETKIDEAVVFVHEIKHGKTA